MRFKGTKIKTLFNLKISYAILFLTLVSWAFFAYFTMNQLIDSQKSYGKIINVSGKQRMLSQKTTLMATRYFELYDKRIMNHLIELRDLMKKDHNFLIHNLTSEKMQKIYFEEPYSLDRDVKHYFKLLDEFILNEDGELLLSIQSYSFKLLPRLNYAVNEFEKESNSIVEELRQREFFILCGTLITLLLELIFLILPTIRAIDESKNKLLTFNQQLEEEVKKQTVQLELEHQQNQFYLDNLNSLLVALDSKGNITMINQTGCELLGYTYDELIGQNWFDIGVLSRVDGKKIKKFFNQVISAEEELLEATYENELLDKDGNRKVFTWANSLLKEDGKIVGIVSSGIDITTQKEQEKFIIEQSKLASMGEMIGNIAHQWRQPLSVISTLATGNIMQKQMGVLKEEKLIKDLDLINDNAQYLSKTIDTFRNFLLEKKEYTEVVIQDRVNNVLQILDSSLSNHYIEVITNFNETEPIKINIIKGELSQVVINIMNNAKDILKERKVKTPWIKIELEKLENNAIVTIEDNAGGIDTKVLPHIFEPYFTTKHKSQGTGLGLHMSHQIITKSIGGKLYAKNTKHGAKFFIELPLNSKLA